MQNFLLNQEKRLAINISLIILLYTEVRKKRLEPQALSNKRRIYDIVMAVKILPISTHLMNKNFVVMQFIMLIHPEIKLF